MFGVSQMTISLIRQGKVWAHIERPEVLHRAPVPRGAKNHRSRLNDDDVRLIRKWLAEGVLSQDAIAKHFGIAQTAISSLHLGSTWAHVT